MHKTTLYLPDALKAAVQRLAAETGRTEAAIIREGIELAISHHTPPPPTIPIFVSGDPHFAEHVDEHLAGFGEQ
ncbi:MAG: ribbon-helix-helix protein, CopG family [Dehalococcoidia bacterium]